MAGGADPRRRRRMVLGRGVHVACPMGRDGQPAETHGEHTSARETFPVPLRAKRYAVRSAVHAPDERPPAKVKNPISTARRVDGRTPRP
jgi:hypothetical protein